MTAKRATLTGQVQRAVDASTMSRNAICRAIGIGKAGFSRFMGGTANLSVPTLEALLKVLGLEVVLRKAGRQKARARKGGG